MSKEVDGADSDNDQPEVPGVSTTMDEYVGSQR